MPSNIPIHGIGLKYQNTPANLELSVIRFSVFTKTK